MNIVRETISRRELEEIAKNQFGAFVKAVVDLERGILAIGGELHADEEALLLEDGSKQNDLWGINLYPEKSEAEWVEFDSMINVRPSQGNSSRDVQDQSIREKIKDVIQKRVA